MNKIVAKEFCKGFLREITNELAQGNTVVLTGLGTIKSRLSDGNGKKFNGYDCRDKFAYLFVPSTKLEERGIEYRKAVNNDV